MRFEDATKEIQSLYNRLVLEEKEYPLDELTEGSIKDILGSQLPIAGNFLLYEDGKSVYVGRSRDLAQRIGTDLRALGKNQANITKKLLDEFPDRFTDMKQARRYFFQHFTIKILKVDNEYIRALLQIYISMELNTKYNTFIEH